ncbi:uncharacterized protein DI49_2110 [Saccharomyces eubayanus]|uniref:uncharacterized protein n=1 Tax=Saccharomyces eubayanus TaxID=1080349 RepID=UPI0006C00171|nr:hypothetical protein DI49_2110 [Saccharomyces eubayanus]KOG99636.1 hypothetical protein DI49_2110 [Saccharomyces eubayanus]
MGYRGSGESFLFVFLLVRAHDSGVFATVFFTALRGPSHRLCGSGCDHSIFVFFYYGVLPECNLECVFSMHSFTFPIAHCPSCPYPSSFSLPLGRPFFPNGYLFLRSSAGTWRLETWCLLYLKTTELLCFTVPLLGIFFSCSLGASIIFISSD